MNEFIYFIKGFFGAPAILLGLFSMLGSILLKRKATETIESSLKAAAGYLILIGGITILSSTLNDFTIAFTNLFYLSGIIPNSDALAGSIMNAIPDIATVASLIMFIAIILNVILAKTSRFKYIFLTGHHILYLSVAISIMFYYGGIDLSKDMWFYLIVGSIFVAIYMLLSPMLSKPYMEFLTNDNKMYIGHANAISFAIAGKIGELVGKIKKGKIKSTEEINFPTWLKVFSNSTVAVTVTMLLIFGITYGSYWSINGKADMVAKNIIASNESVITKIIIDSIKFAAGVEILIFGIKTLTLELIPALEGVSLKWIHGAKMGVDCSIAMYYSPNAVLIGFISSFIAGIIGMSITMALNIIDPKLISAIVIPGIIAHFFTGGVSGTFANIKGGILGTIIAAFVNGILLTIIPIIYLLMQSLYGWEFDTSTHTLLWAESDYAVFSIFGWLININIFEWILLGVALSAILGLVIDGYLYSKRHKNDIINNKIVGQKIKSVIGDDVKEEKLKDRE
ncbi:PTS ascorbate transporter subunit IIC [Spiroplasma endosymbiont of Aspidapion aeneum]|uniref:PTS ascorbate transporter subunit IIC n=1 Tax=Spiroplasma endosymbiont of Aspidapion aeneum TaxID=3066276 RepID=UPI00313E7238